jgi:hypothetical protein
MTTGNDLERMVGEWVRADAARRAPDGLVARITAATASRRPRPAWRSTVGGDGAWPGASIDARSRGLAWFLVAVMALLAIIALAMQGGAARPPSAIVGPLPSATHGVSRATPVPATPGTATPGTGTARVPLAALDPCPFLGYDDAVSLWRDSRWADGASLSLHSEGCHWSGDVARGGTPGPGAAHVGVDMTSFWVGSDSARQRYADALAAAAPGTVTTIAGVGDEASIARGWESKAGTIQHRVPGANAGNDWAQGVVIRVLAGTTYLEIHGWEWGIAAGSATWSAATPGAGYLPSDAQLIRVARLVIGRLPSPSPGVTRP